MKPSPSTILFQGDSITDGGRSRNEDLNHVLGHGYAYLISSRLGMELASKQKRSITEALAEIGHPICTHAGMKTHIV